MSRQDGESDRLSVAPPSGVPQIEARGAGPRTKESEVVMNAVIAGARRAARRGLPLALITSSFLQAQPGVAQVPAPADVIGFAPGEDYKLADYDQVLTYFRALGEASPRVEILDIGESTLGQPMVVAAVSSDANIENLERYRAIAQLLAKAEGLDDTEARRLAGEGKAVVWIDGGPPCHRGRPWTAHAGAGPLPSHR